MNGKEWKICIWIHHIATLIGLGTGLRHLLAGRSGKDRCAVKRTLLFLFVAGQAWAAVKIALTFATGREYMKKSRENLHKICKDEKKEKECAWGLAAACAVFKTGMPALLR